MANIKISNLSNAGALNGSEELPIVQGNATVKTTTQNIANLLGINYTPENVANKDTDATLSANSDTKYPSQKAVKTYVDSTVISAITDNGNWDASGNLFPSVNAQGQPIAKGDLWYISVAGTLGGNAVLPGYSIRALVNTPGQNAASWGIINVGYGFTPENVANKSTDGTLSANSDTLYPSQKAVRTYVNSISAPIPTLQQVTSAGATTTSNITANQYSTAVGSSLLSTGRLVAKDIVLQPTIGNATNQVTLDASSITGNKSYTLPNASGTIALLSSISATSPLSYSNTTGVISMPLATTSQSGYLSSSDWNTFNSKLSQGQNIFIATAYPWNNIFSSTGVLLQDFAPTTSSYQKILIFGEGNDCELGYMDNPIGSGLYMPMLRLSFSLGISVPDVIITNYGFQLPRLTSATIITMSGSLLNPGLMVYQTDSAGDGEGVYVYTSGSVWQKLAWYTP